MPRPASPTVRRRELGALLRNLRTAKGLTVEEVAGLLLCSPSKVSRMETGHRGATLRDVRDLSGIYGVTDPAERDRLMTLAREGKKQGWWQSYSLPYSTYAGLEAEAVSIRAFRSSVVPGLLQTADYARAVQEGGYAGVAQEAGPLQPPVPEVINQRIEARLRRQRLLTQADPLRLWSVLDEAVIRRIVGGPAVMRAQLERLVGVSRLPNVTLQVIPYSAGAHPAMESIFNILDFADGVPSVVYVEGLVGWIYAERPEDLDRYCKVFKYLCDLALTPDASVALITDVSHSYEGS